MTRAALVACLFLAVAGKVAASEALLTLDHSRSHAEFQVKVMWLFAVDGRFGGVEGEVRIDEEARVARVRAEIDATKVEMRRDDYEAWVKSDEFFDAARHPRIVFQSEPFPLTVLAEGGDIVGDLNVRGESHPATFTLAPSETPCANDWAHCTIQAEGQIQRSQFGMRSHRATLGDKVKLHISILPR